MQESLQNIDWNDESAFEAVYLMYFPKLYRLCYAYLEDEDESREIIQSLFHALWERRETLVVHSSVEAYLVRAAKLKILQQRRDRLTEQRHLNQFAITLPGFRNTTEEQLEFEGLSNQLEVLAGQLPPQCQQVFTLSRTRGMSNGEISRMLSITEKAVENQITRALRHLRRGLADYLHF